MGGADATGNGSRGWSRSRRQGGKRGVGPDLRSAAVQGRLETFSGSGIASIPESVAGIPGGKSRELVEMAQKPDAPLADISLCWEAMGDPGLPMFEHLISDPNPDVAFAAARAAAFLGDEAARRAAGHGAGSTAAQSG